MKLEFKESRKNMGKKFRDMPCDVLFSDAHGRLWIRINNEKYINLTASDGRFCTSVVDGDNQSYFIDPAIKYHDREVSKIYMDIEGIKVTE